MIYRDRESKATLRSKLDSVQCFFVARVLYAVTALACFPIMMRGADDFLIGKETEWSYHASAEDPPDDWKQPSFRANNWQKGRSGFGYGDQDDVTVLNEMRGQFSRVQIRTEFSIKNDPIPKTLYLYVNYDDGFIAHLNGKEVLRQNVADENGGIAAGNHEIEGYEQFLLSDTNETLKRGSNTLAIEGFNRSLNSSDFSLQALLSTQAVPNTIGWSVRVFPSGKTVPVHHVFPNRPPSERLPQRYAIEDINELQRRIEDQSSYVRRGHFDWQTAFEELRQATRDDVNIFDFSEQLQLLVAKIGDCHARVDLESRDPRSRYLPFMIGDSRDGIIALKVDRSALLDIQHPIVTAIDGVPIQQWLETATKLVANGSPQLIRNRSLATIRRVDQMRRLLNLAPSNEVTVTLCSKDKTKKRDVSLSLVQRLSPAGRIPIARSRLLEDSIGYLRIEKMENSLEKSVISQMKEFRETKGLIIDVRNNGGGRYGLLRLMHGYLTPPNSKPYVTNIAAYRKSELFSHDHLHYRPTFREDHDGWSDLEREAIQRARTEFSPQWTPPESLFSQWHFMVVGKTPGVGQYHYDKPVVVLCNSESFSATDGFLSCMSDIPGVLLLGEPSGGGSGATRRFRLPRSGIKVALSSMASFRPNGKLFDGNGVEVDIELKPTIEDFLGDSDSVLEKAIELIKRGAEESGLSSQ